MFLGSQGLLLKGAPAHRSFTSYRSDVEAFQADADTEEVMFRFKFSETTHLLGSAKAILYMSCDDADDMDIFLQLRKQDSSGQVLRYYNIPEQEMERQGLQQKDVPMLNTLVYLGPHGQIRASHRKIDQKLSRSHFIRHEHLAEEKVTPGEIVRIETSLWPGGMIFEKDESLVLKIAGHPMYLAEFPSMRGQFKARNTGMHKVHLGGRHASHIVVPFVEL